MLFLDLSFRFLIPLTPSNCSWRQRGSGSCVRSALPVPAHAAPRHCCEPARLPAHGVPAQTQTLPGMGLLVQHVWARRGLQPSPGSVRDGKFRGELHVAPHAAACPAAPRLSQLETGPRGGTRLVAPEGCHKVGKGAAPAC